MSKLLRADLLRLFKDKTFWVGTIFMGGLGSLWSLFKYLIMVHQGVEVPLDSEFFVYSLFIGVVMSVFCSLFIGKDYSDGTIRNKITSGHTRFSIYFSNLIICFIACVLMCVSYIVFSIAVGVPLLGWFQEQIGSMLITALCIFMMAFSFTAIFLLFTMLNQNKAVVAIVCILFSFISLFAAEYIYTQLDEPKMTEEYAYVTDEGTVRSEPAGPNPYYVGGTKRKVYEFAQDFLPGGQSLQLVSGKTEKPEMLAMYSAIIIVITTGAGIILFKKKDLK